MKSAVIRQIEKNLGVDFDKKLREIGVYDKKTERLVKHIDLATIFRTR